MTLYHVTHWDHSGELTERLGKTKKGTLLRGDTLEYKTDEGKCVQLGKVQKAIPMYDEDSGITEMYYTVNNQEYCIIDERKRQKLYKRIYD
jgi:hypothetical protein